MISKQIRPRFFKDVIGHKANIKAFELYAKENSFPDVMLFQGNSGSGKTTCANIIATTINCENPKINESGYPEPCLECPNCKSVVDETYMHDTHFFNASEMGPEDVIKLEERASMSPWHGGKKTIIIIDEFQQLSAKSKGATLVLLEKKRKDSIFILCTMDVKGIDKAIQSRAQTYLFKPLNTNEIGESIIKTLELIDPEEKIPFDSKSLVLLAQNSWGSARQAQQYLERCIASELWTVEQIEQEFNFMSEEKGYEIFNDLINKNVDFYKKLESVKSENFYIYAWSIISSANKSLIMCHEEDWKYINSKKIILNINFIDLCETFILINKEIGTYFKEYIFDYYISKYMSKSVPKMVRERVKK